MLSSVRWSVVWR